MSPILYTNNRLKSLPDRASLAVEVFLFVKLETMNSIATCLLPLVLCLSISWPTFAAYPPAQKKATTRLPSSPPT